MWSVFDLDTNEVTVFDEDNKPIVFKRKKDALDDLFEYADNLNEARKMEHHPEVPIKGKITKGNAEEVANAIVRKVSPNELEKLVGSWGGYKLEESTK